MLQAMREPDPLGMSRGLVCLLYGAGRILVQQARQKVLCRADVLSPCHVGDTQPAWHRQGIR